MWVKSKKNNILVLIGCWHRKNIQLQIQQYRLSGSFRMKATSYVTENFKRMHGSIKPPVWSRCFVAKFVWIQFSWVGCGPRLHCAHPRTVRAQRALTHNPPAKLDLDKATKRRDQTGGLIESCTRLKLPPPPGYASACEAVEFWWDE